ncbi:hypothetical protein AAVH_40158, partial [Aphelenchoides avenae]
GDYYDGYRLTIELEDDENDGDSQNPNVPPRFSAKFGSFSELNDTFSKRFLQRAVIKHLVISDLIEELPTMSLDFAINIDVEMLRVTSQRYDRPDRENGVLTAGQLDDFLNKFASVRALKMRDFVLEGIDDAFLQRCLSKGTSCLGLRCTVRNEITVDGILHFTFASTTEKLERKN